MLVLQKMEIGLKIRVGGGGCVKYLGSHQGALSSLNKSYVEVT